MSERPFEGKPPGRNDPCWCGSGLKYKKCHMQDDDESDRHERRPASAAYVERTRWLGPFVHLAAEPGADPDGDPEAERRAAEILLDAQPPEIVAALDAVLGDDDAARSAPPASPLVAWAIAWTAWERGDADELAACGKQVLDTELGRELLDAAGCAVFVARGLEELRGARGAVAWLDERDTVLAAQPGLEPLRTDLLLEAGELLLDASEPDRAEPFLSRAAALAPDDPLVAAARAEALFELGKAKEAARVARGAIGFAEGLAVEADLRHIIDAAENAAKREQEWHRGTVGDRLATVDPAQADPDSLWEALGRVRRFAERGRLRGAYEEAWQTFEAEAGLAELEEEDEESEREPRDAVAPPVRDGELEEQDEELEAIRQWAEPFGELWVLADLRAGEDGRSLLGLYADSSLGAREQPEGLAALRAAAESRLDVVEALDDADATGLRRIRSLLDGRERSVRVVAGGGDTAGEPAPDDGEAGPTDVGEGHAGLPAPPAMLRFETFLARIAPAREPTVLCGVAVPRRQAAALVRALRRMARLDLGVAGGESVPLDEWLGVAGGRVVPPVVAVLDVPDHGAPTDTADGERFEPHVAEIVLSPSAAGRAREALDGSRLLVRGPDADGDPAWFHVREQRRGGGRGALVVRLAAIRLRHGLIEAQGLSEGSARRARNLVGRLLEVDVDDVAVDPVPIEDPAERYSIRWRAWVDEPVRGLGGRTPREAAADPASHAQLVELLRPMEVHERRASGLDIATVGIEALASELGVSL